LIIFRKSRYLKPRRQLKSLKEINLACLWKQGKRGLVLDLDNTISPWRENEVTPEADSLIREALRLKYKVCLLSNASSKRVESIARRYNIPFVAPALKPLKKPYRKAMALMKLQSEQVIAVGDQLFTDVLGGNRSGCYTVLVPPLNKREFLWTRLMRAVESLVIENGSQNVD
jgi:HAD superfamily phosphatase (TIGR01668 family)